MIRNSLIISDHLKQYGDLPAILLVQLFAAEPYQIGAQQILQMIRLLLVRPDALRKFRRISGKCTDTAF